MEDKTKQNESFDSYQDLIYQTDSKGIIISANKGFCKIFGYSKNELIGMDIFKLYYKPEHRLLFLSEMENRGGILTDYIVIVKGKNNNMIYLSLDCSFIDEKKINGVEGIGRDVTSKLNLSDGYFQTNYEGTITFANKGFSNLVGYDNHIEIIEKKLQELVISNDEFNKIKNKITPDSITNSSSYEKELGPLFINKYILLKINGLIDANNILIGFEGLIIDISETQLLRKILEVVGHELFAHVVAIDGTIESIIYKINRMDYNIHKIYQKLEDIKLFNKLMEYLVIDINVAGYGTPIVSKTTIFNLKELIENTIFFVKPILKLNCLDSDKIIIKYSENIEEKIYADKLHFMQIFFNLIINFIKYKNEDPNKFEAKIIVHQKTKPAKKIQTNKLVYIDVIDYGIGIPDDEEKNIFQPGYKASNTKTLPGKGLGLKVVKTLLSKYGGSIFVKSKSNPTVFRIELNETLFQKEYTYKF